MHPAFAAVPLLYLSVLVPIKETVDSFVGIKKITDRCIMVQRIDQKSDVFAHVAADVIFAGQKLRGLIYQVGSQYAIEQSFFVSLIEFFHTIGEQTKGGIQEDSFRMKGFQLSCYINHALTGGDHVINDQNIFSFYIAARNS